MHISTNVSYIRSVYFFLVHNLNHKFLHLEHCVKQKPLQFSWNYIINRFYHIHLSTQLHSYISYKIQLHSLNTCNTVCCILREQVQSQVNPCGSVVYRGTGTGFSPSASGSPCQYHPINVSHSFIHLSLMLYKDLPAFLNNTL